MMFTFVAFVLAVVGQEFARGAAGAAHDDRRVAGRARSCAWRGATGAATAATWCTPGSRCCSSAWRRPRRSSSSATCACRPGDSFELDGYEVTYRARHRLARRRRAPAPARRSRSARCCDVRRGGDTFTLRPSRNYYSTAGPLARARSRASSRARPPARSTCAGGCGATSGWRCGPTSTRSTAPIREARPRVLRLARPTSQALVIARARRALPRQPAAGGVPRDRLAAGGVDLDRRRDRRARRARGALAVAGGAPAAGALASTRRGWAASSRAPDVRSLGG